MNNDCQQSHFSPIESRKRTCLVCMTQCVCDTLFHLSCTPMVKIVSPYTRTENGTMSFEWPEYFCEVQTDEKSEMMLKRVRFHTVTQQRVDVFVPLCTCKGRMTAMFFSRCQAKKQQHREYDKGVYNVMFFLGEAPFLIVCCWLWKQKVTEKTRGDKRPESKVRKERRSLMKQENTTGAGSRWVAGSLVLWGVLLLDLRCCAEKDKKQGLTSHSTRRSSVVMSAILQMDGKSLTINNINGASISPFVSPTNWEYCLFNILLIYCFCY